MGQRIITQTVSDVSGAVIPDGDAVHVPLVYGGAEYALDLTKTEADDLQSALDPFLGGVKPAGTVRPRRRNGASQRNPDGDAAKIRQWAKEQGMEVSERGRVSGEVRAAYKAAH